MEITRENIAQSDAYFIRNPETGRGCVIVTLPVEDIKGGSVSLFFRLDKLDGERDEKVKMPLAFARYPFEGMVEIRGEPGQELHNKLEPELQKPPCETSAEGGE